MASKIRSILHQGPAFLFAWLETTSLRFRLSLWHVAFTFLCMSCYGAVLSQYLHYQLRASREQTMLSREQRFLAFVNNGLERGPGSTLTTEIRHFSEASPDSDVIEILTPAGARLYPTDHGAPRPALPYTGEICSVACLSTFSSGGHHWRLLTHRTTLGGNAVLLLMAA